jgi:hypothetical protein
MRKILALLALLIATPALAQTTPNSYMALQKIQPAAQKFVQGVDAPGTYKTIYIGGTNGSICFNLIAMANDQTTPHLVSIRYTTAAAATFDICSATVSPASPALGANLFGPAVGVFFANNCPLPISQAGNAYMQLKAGDLLQASYTTALTAGNQINLIAQCGDF